jgi:hypothetical protein
VVKKGTEPMLPRAATLDHFVREVADALSEEGLASTYLNISLSD